MQFSKWHALGNSYLVVEQPDAGHLTPARVQRLCSIETGIGSDGVLEVVQPRRQRTRRSTIWNPDGSTAEMSGQRRPDRRPLARGGDRGGGGDDRDGRPARRGAHARRRSTADTDVGAVTVGAPEHVDGIELTTASVGNPHAVDPARRSDPRRSPPARAARRDARALSRAHERPARSRRRTARPHGARLGARSGGDERVRLVVGRGGGRRGRARMVRQPGHRASAGRRPAGADRGRAARR